MLKDHDFSFGLLHGVIVQSEKQDIIREVFIVPPPEAELRMPCAGEYLIYLSMEEQFKYPVTILAEKFQSESFDIPGNSRNPCLRQDVELRPAEDCYCRETIK